jgi:hypothetical protein
MRRFPFRIIRRIIAGDKNDEPQGDPCPAACPMVKVTVADNELQPG